MFYRKDPRDQQQELDRKPTEDEIRYGEKPTCYGVHERLCVSCDVRFYTKKNKKYNSYEYVLMDIGSYIMIYEVYYN